MQVKQVIVMRHDLSMRRGKQIAQGSHASMSFLCKRLQTSGIINIDLMSEVERDWLFGIFTKVCCRVNSEQELMDIFNKAKEAGLEAHLIIDSGKTEFNGVPTPTCVAIGPDHVDKIDVITGNLQLL